MWILSLRRVRLVAIGGLWMACAAFAAHAQPAPLPFSELLYTGKVRYFYNDASDPKQQQILESVRSIQLMEKFARFAASTVRWQSDIAIGMESCGTPTAAYSRQRRAIVLCTEFITLMKQVASQDATLLRMPKDEFAKVVKGLVMGVILHELGHAIIDVNRVPVTGREEDVADQFTAWIAIHYVDTNAQPLLMPYAWFWARLSTSHDLSALSEADRRRLLADEHSLDLQRMYNVACWAIGARSAEAERLARLAKLPQERLNRCPNEWARGDHGMRSQFRRYLKGKPLSGAW